RADVLLERHLETVGEGLQQAQRPGPVRPRPGLHPRHHPTLEPDPEQGHDHAEHERGQDLDEDEPPHVPAEVGQGGCLGQRHRSPPAETVTIAPAVTPSRRWTPAPGELVGSHTTPSTRSVTAARRVSAPADVLTVTGSPSATPSRPASSLPTRTTAGRAVPSRGSLPSASGAPWRGWCRVASTACPPPGRAGGGGATRGAGTRGAVVAGSDAISERIAATSPPPSWTPS